jgi:hypothetical protein
MARDAVKAVYYRSLGYAFYHPWASYYDTTHRAGRRPRPRAVGTEAREALPEADIPCLAQGYRLGPNLGAGATGTAKGNTARAAHRLKAGLRLSSGSGRTIRHGR